MADKAEGKNSLKMLKFRNRQVVLNFLRGASAVSVNEISRASNLSKMTIHKIIDYYLKKEVVSNAGKGMSTEEGGKKPNLFSFNPDCRYIVSVRLDDGIFETVILNLKGRQVSERAVHSLEGVSFDAFLELFRKYFEDLVARTGVTLERCIGVVVACNGLVDYENGIWLLSNNNPDWEMSLPIRDGLSRSLPCKLPVYVDNWFKFQAYGQMLAAEPGERRRFFLLGTHSDVFSGGMVVDGALFWGNMGLSGEIGHMIVSPDGEMDCRCGGRGCLEVEVAPSRMVAKAKAAEAKNQNSRVFRRDEQQRDIQFEDIAEAANHGDEFAQSLMDEAARHLAVAINNIVNTCDPGVVVVHGDYARAGEYFKRKLHERFNKTSLRGIDRRTRLEFSTSGDEVGLVGAAYLTTDEWIQSKMD